MGFNFYLAVPIAYQLTQNFTVLLLFTYSATYSVTLACNDARRTECKIFKICLRARQSHFWHQDNPRIQKEKYESRSKGKKCCGPSWGIWEEDQVGNLVRKKEGRKHKKNKQRHRSKWCWGNIISGAIERHEIQHLSFLLFLYRCCLPWPFSLLLLVSWF